MSDRPPNLPEDETPQGDADALADYSQDEIDAALAAASGADLTDSVDTGGGQQQPEAKVAGEESGVNTGEQADSAGWTDESRIDDPAVQETSGGQGHSTVAPPVAAPLEMPDFGGVDATVDANELAMLGDVRLDVKIELGRADIYIEDVLKLGKGSVVELDRLAGDPVDVLVNERLVARGEVLVLNDNFCVRISEILVGKDP